MRCGVSFREFEAQELIPGDFSFFQINYQINLQQQQKHRALILTVLLFWTYFFASDASICSTMAFPTLGNADYVVVSVSIDFPSFYRISYDYSRADWDGLIII